MNTTKNPHDFRGLRRTMHTVGPDLMDRMRAALEDAGVTRRQWRILAALEDGPLTAEAIDESAKRRHRGRGTAAADAPADLAADAADGLTAEPGTAPDPEVAERGHRGHPFGGPGRFGRRGFGPGFGPFGRGFGPGFGHGHGFGPHADRHGRRRPAAEVLDGLAERGWVQRTDDAWSLTETGAAELDRIRAKVDAVKAGLREGISDDDWDTAMSVLQRVAENARR